MQTLCTNDEATQAETVPSDGQHYFRDFMVLVNSQSMPFGRMCSIWKPIIV